MEHIRLEDDETTCSCSTEEELTPHTILERIYRRLEGYSSTSSDDSCCAGPKIDDDDYTLDSDGTEFDDNEGGGRPTTPPPPDPVVPRNLPAVYDGPNDSVNYVTTLSTFVTNIPFNLGLVTGLEGYQSNAARIASIDVVETVSRLPATPAQQTYFNALFSDVMGVWLSCPVENDIELECTITFQVPFLFNCMNVQGPFSFAYVFKDPPLNNWDPGEPLPPQKTPLPPGLKGGFRNWQLLTDTDFVHYDHVRDLNLTQEPNPTFYGWNRLVEFDSAGFPKHVVFRFGMISSIDPSGPGNTENYLLSVRRQFHYGLTHKLRLFIRPSDMVNTQIINFSEASLPGT